MHFPQITYCRVDTLSGKCHGMTYTNESYLFGPGSLLLHIQTIHHIDAIIERMILMHKGSMKTHSSMSRIKYIAIDTPKEVHITNINRVNHSCHHPDLPISCNRRVVRDIEGIIVKRRKASPKKGMIKLIMVAGIAARTKKRIHHQYSALVDLPLKTK